MRLGPAVALILSALNLSALALSAVALPVAASGVEAVLVGAFRWDADARWFGGFSGIELSDDGRRFRAITDRGSLVIGRIGRDGGRLTSITMEARVELGRSGKDPLTGRHRDSEGIALRRDGSFCISFEHTNRTGCWARPGAEPTVLDAHPDFRRLHPNSTLEALAVDPRNRLLVIPENAPTPDGPFPAYRWENGGWRRVFDLPRRGTFLPVGADFGPDGRLYLLERDSAGIGFRSRVRSWNVAGDVPFAERVHLETFYLTHGNLEGLSVWRDEAGRIRLTMISDNNFMSLLRTEIVEYALPPLANHGATN